MYDGHATIVLEARDVDGSAEYYQRVLGFTLEGWWHADRHRLSDARPESLERSFVELSAGPTRIRLRPVAEVPSVGCDIALSVSDLDVLHRRVAELDTGATRPKAGHDGRRRFAVIDPDGHRWTLVQA